MIKKSKIVLFLISLFTMMNCDTEYVEFNKNYLEWDLPKVIKVATFDVYEVTSNSAICHGEIISNGDSEITNRGFCYATSTNPTTSDNFIYSDASTYFNGYIDNLQPNTTYYVRAFAINSNETGYGNQVSFTTNQ